MHLDLKQLSTTLAHALRHEPERYGLTLDEEGWVEVADLLAALAKYKTRYHGLTRDDLLEVITQSDKPRYELVGDHIRARYGHTVEKRIEYPPATPPETLYHGTNDRSIEAILSDGLQPMARQYVHLSANPQDAKRVGQRKKGVVIVLTIQAAAAYADGVVFYERGEGIWLADYIPARYIEGL